MQTQKPKKPTRLEFLRRGKGISLEALAREAGVTATILCRVEGIKTVAYPKLRKVLANALGVEENKLFDSEGFAKTLKRR